MSTWRPAPSIADPANVNHFARAVLGDDAPADPAELYSSLYAGSVEDAAGFWRAVWDYYDVAHDGVLTEVLTGDPVRPTWFPGTRLNVVEHMIRGRDPESIALWHADETTAPTPLTWRELIDRAAAIQHGLRTLGVRPGDRIGVVLPNIAETVAAFFAVAGMGAIWVAAAPEFGIEAIRDRFEQVDPALILGCDGYVYGGRSFDTRERLESLAGDLGTDLVVYGHLDGRRWPGSFLGESAATSLTTSRVPFDHPIWVVFTSGTTGRPKPLIHGHGGILLEYLKHHHLHLDLRPGDCLFWYTTTGWIMWNVLIGGLLTPASVLLYDGHPTHPTPDALWEIADRAGVTCFGANPGFLMNAEDSGVEIRRGGRNQALRAVGSTGAPLPTRCYDWVLEQLPDPAWLFSTSGGTEVASALVCGVPTVPIIRGEIQCRALGVAAEAWNAEGESLVDELGELVITAPLPSMPVGMWGPGGEQKLLDTYYARFPGVWAHGDWVKITSRGGVVIAGRSDATINRGGVRAGTSEIYQAVLTVDGVTDALAVDVHREDDLGRLLLFVELSTGTRLDDALVARIRSVIRARVSPRHVPDLVVAAPELPRTISGKLLEVPVKRIMQGERVTDVVDPDSTRNPDALAFFADLAAGMPW